MSKTPATTCDVCARDMPKAHKVHLEVRYCGTCYARCFKRQVCPGCGVFARLLASDLEATCTACVAKQP
ncbi:hypothetical protein ABTL56_19270, partial [Acinetobacter baumannii]